jgi:hypothetical protein
MFKWSRAVQDLEDGAVYTVYLAMKPPAEMSPTTAPAPAAPLVSDGSAVGTQPAMSEAPAVSGQSRQTSTQAVTSEGNARQMGEPSVTAADSSQEAV